LRDIVEPRTALVTTAEVVVTRSFPQSFVVCLLVAAFPSLASGDQISGPDRDGVLELLFQGGPGDVVLDFESLAALDASTFVNGTLVPAENQLSRPGSGFQELADLHFHSGDGAFGGAAGTPVAVLDLQGALASEASLGNQVLAPLIPGTSQLCVGATCVLDILFEEPLTKFMLWTGFGGVLVFARTYEGDILQVAGSGDTFLGIRTDIPNTPTIERVTIVAQSDQGFVIDELRYVVPEPSTLLLLGLGLSLLELRSRRPPL
jgi:hypothetical protein